MLHILFNTLEQNYAAKMHTKLSETFLKAKSSRFNLLSYKHTLGHKARFLHFITFRTRRLYSVGYK